MVFHTGLSASGALSAPTWGSPCRGMTARRALKLYPRALNCGRASALVESTRSREALQPRPCPLFVAMRCKAETDMRGNEALTSGRDAVQPAHRMAGRSWSGLRSLNNELTSSRYLGRTPLLTVRPVIRVASPSGCAASLFLAVRNEDLRTCADPFILRST